MAVASEDTLYQSKMAPLYVSSNGYYGYVPPNPVGNKETVEANDLNVAAISGTTGDLSWSLTVPSTMQQLYQHHQQNNQHELMCFNGSAMETDDDDNSRRDNVRVSRYENNHCVIPEPVGLRLDTSASSCESICRMAELDEVREAARCRGGNRKRNSTSDPACFAAGHWANITKKSRKDGGNSNVNDGAGYSIKRGSPTLQYEPTPLSTTRNNEFCRVNNGVGGSTSATDEGCCAAAGNYDSPNHSNVACPYIVTTNGHDTFGQNYLDYEIMLMETHGCSAYYHHQHRLDISVSEAEF